MAIALDSANNGATGTGTSISWSHTCTGSNLILWVGVLDVNGNTDTITGVTYNGVSMTRASDVINFPTDGRSVFLYYLVAPATGSNTVQVNSSASHTLFGASTSYTGAKQSGQPDATNSGSSTGGTSPLTVSVTTTADNCWLVGWVHGNGTIGAGSNTTFRGTPNSAMNMLDSNGAQTPPGSFSQNVTTTSGYLAMPIASFSPEVASSSKHLALLGVG